MNFLDTFGKMLMILFAIVMGGLANRLGYLTREMEQKLTKLVLNLALPCVILGAVMTGEAQPDMDTILSIWKLTAAYYAVTAVMTLVIPPLVGGTAEQKGVWRHTLFFTNAVFVGYAVLDALFGQRAVFYAVLLTLPAHVLSFSLGPLMLGGRRRFSWRCLCTPCMIVSVLSLVIVLTGLRLPALAGEVLGFVGGLSSPLSLLVVGSVLSGMPAKQVLAMPRIWIISVFRLLVLPVLLVFCLRPLGLDPLVVRAGVVIMAGPAAVHGFMVAMEFGGDSECMAQSIFLSTLLSIVTIPLVVTLV